MDSGKKYFFSFALDPLLKVTGRAQRKQCYGANKFVQGLYNFLLSLSLSLSLSSYFFLNALLLYVALLNLRPCWIIHWEKEIGLNRNVMFKIVMGKKRKKKIVRIFSCVLHFFMPSLLFDLL